jgi:hypothetical protein
LCQEFGVTNFAIQMMWENRTKIFSECEWNGLRIMLFHKPEQSDIDEVLLNRVMKSAKNNPPYVSRPGPEECCR